MRSLSRYRQAGIPASARSRARARSMASVERLQARGKPGCAGSPVAQVANPLRFAKAPANQTIAASARFGDATAARFQRAAQARARAEVTQSPASMAKAAYLWWFPGLSLHLSN